METSTTVRILRTAGIALVVIGLMIVIVCWMQMLGGVRIPGFSGGSWVAPHQRGTVRLVTGWIMAAVFVSSMLFLSWRRWIAFIGLLACLLYVTWAWLPAL